MLKYLLAELSQHVLNSLSKINPPYHVTEDNVSTFISHLAKKNDHRTKLGPLSLRRPPGDVRDELNVQPLATSIFSIGSAFRTSTVKLTRYIPSDANWFLPTTTNGRPFSSIRFRVRPGHRFNSPPQLHGTSERCSLWIRWRQPLVVTW